MLDAMIAIPRACGPRSAMAVDRAAIVEVHTHWADHDDALEAEFALDLFVVDGPDPFGGGTVHLGSTG